jgi:ZIP family zinc transporter
MADAPLALALEQPLPPQSPAAALPPSDKDEGGKPHPGGAAPASHRRPLRLAYGALLLLCAAGAWRRLQHGAAQPMTPEMVFWEALATCIATGLGAVPFLFLSSLPGEQLLGLCNAAAAGMMLAASATLAWEGCHSSGGEGGGGGGGGWPLGAAAGAALGVGAIVATKPLLDAWGGSESVFRGMEAADARKALLLCLVMFAHSATEGVSIGVSYTGAHALGRFVALSLAIHNIPEGLVTCLALVPRGVPPAEAALWAVLTSLSQPLLAPLAFWWVQVFQDLLAPGLGFAAGAMAWVAAAELLPEAQEQLRGRGGRRLLVGVAAVAGAGMLGLSHLVRE